VVSDEWAKVNDVLGERRIMNEEHFIGYSLLKLLVKGVRNVQVSDTTMLKKETSVGSPEILIHAIEDTFKRKRTL
jgi:hypothetical protein